LVLKKAGKIHKPRAPFPLAVHPLFQPALWKPQS
jgi:hypothetical protein